MSSIHFFYIELYAHFGIYIVLNSKPYLWVSILVYVIKYIK